MSEDVKHPEKQRCYTVHTKDKNFGEDTEKLEPLCTLLVGMQNSIATMKNSKDSSKIKDEVPCDQKSYFLDLYA